MTELFEITAEAIAQPWWVNLLALIAILGGGAMVVLAFTTNRAIVAMPLIFAGIVFAASGAGAIATWMGGSSASDDTITKALSQQLELKNVDLDGSDFTATRDDGQYVSGTVVEDPTDENVYFVHVVTP